MFSQRLGSSINAVTRRGGREVHRDDAWRRGIRFRDVTHVTSVATRKAWPRRTELWYTMLTVANVSNHTKKLESSQSPHTSAKAMLFARWQHRLRFCSGFPYAPLKAMITKISKWSRIQDSFQITPKIKSLVVCAIPDISSKFQKDPSITCWVILLTRRQTDRQTNSLAKTLPPWRR